ncbi:hypothetical protein SAMN05421507_10341 [Lentzea jiangxiensis]|uniref:Uncharacterized protein n=1 Tax=Lentzea jiangxiensis TaxID=641025 RepID=A0A1H0KRH5_9PSEU|nr:hypothetical protein SAMN05421507_10341 [Lentzea jiangxiensis]
MPVVRPTVPVGNRTVTILDLGSRAHTAVVRAC